MPVKQLKFEFPETNYGGRYFELDRDLMYPCFCQACLVGKRGEEMSEDPRYCTKCQTFIKKEGARSGRPESKTSSHQ